MHADTCPEVGFDCIGEADQVAEGFAPAKLEDQRGWAESVPAKMGLYHALDQREHRLFIVVSGCLRQAVERLYNLWLDTGAKINCRDLLESEEVNWLRTATVRSSVVVVVSVVILQVLLSTLISVVT